MSTLCQVRSHFGPLVGVDLDFQDRVQQWQDSFAVWREVSFGSRIGLHSSTPTQSVAQGTAGLVETATDRGYGYAFGSGDTAVRQVLGVAQPQDVPAVLALGTAGYAIAGLYVVLKAPDLALTQIMIESASVVLFLLVFWYLPELQPIARSKARAARDWALAIFLGGSAAAGMALAMNSHYNRTIADYFMRTSKPLAGF